MSNFPADAALTLRKKRGFSVCSVAGSRSRDYQSNPHFQCGIALRAFSVWDALRFRSYGLSFRKKTRPCRSRWAGRRCACRVAFAFSPAKRFDPSPLPLSNDKSAPFFHLGRSHFMGIFLTRKTVSRRKNAVFRQTSNRTACRFAEEHAHSVHVGPGGAVPPPASCLFQRQNTNAVR